MKNLQKTHFRRSLFGILMTLFSFFIIKITVFAAKDSTIIDGLINNQTVTIMDIDSPEEGGLDTLNTLLGFTKDSISGLLLIIVIGVFLFMGMKLVMARGNAEELKKVMLQFIYVAIGMFIVSMAWAVVTLVSGLSI